jgi:4-amino-4-deoxy-L-arabinose transferase-like glycosyltransferase
MLNRPGPKLLLLLFAAFGVYLVGNQSVPLWDRDEPRFAQTSRQMLQSGDWVVPRLYDNVRTAKPPLIYWVQAASMKLIGEQGPAAVFAVRLPSSIAMTLTLTVLAVVLWRYAGAGHALWSALILSTCALTMLAAKAGLTDSVLLLFVTIAQLCLYAVWRGHGSWGVTIVMAIAIGLALLTKGPVAIGIQAMTLVGLGLLKVSLRWSGSRNPDALAEMVKVGDLEYGGAGDPSASEETLRFAQGNGLTPSVQSTSRPNQSRAAPAPGKEIFLSHASADKRTADRLCSLLEGQGVRCWIAPRDVQPGQDYGESIIEAIEATRVTVLLLSSNANSSVHVKNEIERATSKRKRVVPIRLEDVLPNKSLELHLSTTQWIDALHLGLDQVALQLAAVVKAESSNAMTPSRAIGETLRGAGMSAVLAVAKIVVGLLIVLVIGLPWVILVEKRHPGFISTALNHEIKDRAASGLEGHKGPPGYYLVSIWPTFLPWSLVLPLALVMGWKNRRDPRVGFALAAVAGPWVMFEVVQTKLPHYLLPCFPPLAFLTADAILRSLRRPVDQSKATGGGRITPGPMQDPGFAVGVHIWAGIAVVLGAVPWAAARWFRPLPWGNMALISLFAIAYAATVTFFFRRRRAVAGLASMGVGMFGVSLVLFGLYLPATLFLQLSKEAGQVLRDHGVTGPDQVVMLDYKEPSLAFYQGGTIREDSAMVASAKLLDSSPQWLVITEQVYNAGATDRARLEVVARFKGLDLSAGLRVIEVLVVKKKDSSETSRLLR